MTGGLLSNLQLVLDCVALDDFSGLTGNIPKLLLGQASIVFDVIFCFQHYVLYPETNNEPVHVVFSSQETEALADTGS